MQSQRRFQRKYSAYGIVEPLRGYYAFFITVEHKRDVLFYVFCEQKHITACGNGGRNGSLSRHGARKARHGGRICHDKPVEAEFVAEQSRQNIAAQRCRQSCWADERQAYMSRHNAHNARINTFTVYSAVSFQPIFLSEIVDRRGDVLIPFVTSVSREMFYARRNAAFLHFFYIRSAHLCHGFGVAAERSCIGYRVSEIVIYIGDRRKRPVDADGTGFRAAYLSETARLFRSSRRGYRHFGSE